MQEEFSQKPEANQLAELRYLIPLLCYEKLQTCNKSDSQENKKIKYEELKLIYKDFIDSYLLDFKFHILKELESSFKIGKIQQILVCPKIQRRSDWRILKGEEWNQILMKFPHFSYKIPILYLENEPQFYFHESLVKISIIFQSQKCVKSFVGFIPVKTPLVRIITVFGSQLGFSGFITSSFSVLNSDTVLHFQNLQRMEADDFKETPFLISNLFYGVDNTSSMAAERSGQANWEEFLQQNTLLQQNSASTGIDTVLHVAGGRRSRRIRILSVKSKEQIEQMKIRSQQILHSPKIIAPQRDQKEMLYILEELAKQSLGSFTI